MTGQGCCPWPTQGLAQTHPSKAIRPSKSLSSLLSSVHRPSLPDSQFWHIEVCSPYQRGFQLHSCSYGCFTALHWPLPCVCWCLEGHLSIGLGYGVRDVAKCYVRRDGFMMQILHHSVSNPALGWEACGLWAGLKGNAPRAPPCTIFFNLQPTKSLPCCCNCTAWQHLDSRQPALLLQLHCLRALGVMAACPTAANALPKST